MGKSQIKMHVEVVGEFTEWHAKGLMEISYRIWKRHLTEQAEQKKREHEEKTDVQANRSIPIRG